MKRTIVILIVIVLVLPILYKDRKLEPVKGPSLSELKYDEVFFENGELDLAGMLFLPEGEGPFPAVVVIHGSGSSKRDSKWYLSIAKHLQDKNIIVLLPDKRGSEKSEGNWVGASFNDLANDSISALQYLQTRDDLNISKIGFLGMSQGGWIAPLAASKGEADFVISMSGAIVTTNEQLLYEEVNRISGYTYQPFAKVIAPITVKSIEKKDFYQPLAGFDPIPYWKKITVPVFIAFGEGDKNVPIDASIQNLNDNNFNYLIRTYSAGGHGILDKENKVQIEFLNDLSNFISSL